MITRSPVFVIIFRYWLCPAVLFLTTLSYCSDQKNATVKSGGPFIDSVGFESARVRNAEIADGLMSNSQSMVTRALTDKSDPADDSAGEDIFRSLEESYQRYVAVFKPATIESIFKTQSEYDLPATFRLSVFDRQPFMNALLHSLSFHSLTTLDYIIEEGNRDTCRIRVNWAAPLPKDSTGFTIKEGSLNLIVTKHEVTCLNPELPGK